jgi:hypothetical protein
MYRSSDGGQSWEGWDLPFEKPGYIGGFAILRDDTFLLAFMPNYTEFKEICVGSSTDLGRSWDVEKMDGEIRPYGHIVMDNGDLLELSDGTVLMTCNLRYMYRMEDAVAHLPIGMWGSFAHLFRSPDGGVTWPEKCLIGLANSAETHLLELPSGRLLAAVRKQRSHRLPGDPKDLIASMRANGYEPEYRGYEEPIDEGHSGTALFKSVFLLESQDGGRTWVNERRVSGYEQCSGEITLLSDRTTLVLQYDHRYHDRFADAGVRAKVSLDAGRTWEPEEYILGEGENYPGGIATHDGGLITVCPYCNEGPIQAVHWEVPTPRARADRLGETQPSDPSQGQL